MFPQYSVIMLYILIATICCYSKANLHCFYALCAITIANHILIIATYPNTNQATIATLVIAVFAIYNYILTNKINTTLLLFGIVIMLLIADTALEPLIAPNINIHLLMSCMLGAVTILATLQSYCIFIQNYRLKQATRPEENLLPLTTLGDNLKYSAIAGLVLTTILAISGFYSIGKYDSMNTTKIILTLAIWLIFAALLMKKSILKISLTEKSFLMTISVLLSISACIFCMYLG